MKITNTEADMSRPLVSTEYHHNLHVNKKQIAFLMSKSLSNINTGYLT